MTPVSATPDIHERRATVLLVEDELLLRWPAGEYLRDAGYRVIEAASAWPLITSLKLMSENTRSTTVPLDSTAIASLALAASITR